MSEEKLYTMEEMDVIMEKHIHEQAEILRKNLQKKGTHKNIEYV